VSAVLSQARAPRISIRLGDADAVLQSKRPVHLNGGLLEETTVVVVEQSPRYREWITAAVGSRRGLRLAAECTDGAEALEQIRRLRPTVASLAVRLPGLGGIDLVRAIIAEGLPTRPLVVGSPLGVSTITDALDAGAWGYVWKGNDQSVIADAIASVGRGELFLGPRVQAELFETVRMRANGGRLELTERETQVLALVAEGCPTRQIAEQLGISVPTVKTHLQRVCLKLAVTDRSAAVAKAMRYGLLA
jgi:two-component system nitrate/nitrite response regulator NarL